MSGIGGATKALLKALRLREGHARNDADWYDRSVALRRRMSDNMIHISRFDAGKDMKVAAGHAELDNMNAIVDAIIELDDLVFGELPTRPDKWHYVHVERAPLYTNWKWGDTHVEAWKKAALKLQGSRTAKH